MAVMDYIQSAFDKIAPPKRLSTLASRRGKGIGNTIGAAEFEDEMIISKPAVICYIGIAFFNFLAMCCFAGVASFQAKWGVGPSGLTGFALFISVMGVVIPLVLMFVPVIDAKYNKLSNVARVLSETRVSFVSAVTGVSFSLLIAFITTISAWTEPGCKNPNNDPHAKLGDSFKNGLSAWCTTKKAGAVFFWITSGFWLGSFIIVVLDWRSGKASRPRDPPFQPPASSEATNYDQVEEDDESQFEHITHPRDSVASSNPFGDNAAANRQSQYESTSALPQIPVSRLSMDTYGAFNDPEPSGYGGALQRQPQSFGEASGLATATTPGVSRTMQYADPYAQVRASLANAGGSPNYGGGPPSYESGFH